MGLISQTLPGLWGGVSQQAPAMRHETHCAIQENAVSSMIDGVSKRQGTTFIKQIEEFNPYLSGDIDTEAEVFTHFIDYADGEKYMVIAKGQAMKITNLVSGVDATISAPDTYVYLTDGFGNLATDLRAVTVADYTFIVNRTRTVAINTADTAVNPLNVAYFVVTKAANGVDYTMGVDGYSHTETIADTGIFTLGDIATALKNGLATALGGGYTVSIVAGTENVIKVVRGLGDIASVLYRDSMGNSSGYCINEGVRKYSDLPPKFETGYTVLMVAEADTQNDDYFVKWDGERWIEAKEPNITDHFDPLTMPHKLVRTALNTFTFSKITEWKDRLVGDNTTNPVPSFVGGKISDVFFFRNRLGFLSGENVIMSGAGSYFQFWAESARAVLDSDPIDVPSTSERGVAFNYAVPIDAELLVFSADAQFVLAGGDVLSPKNARLTLKTTYDSDSNARPVPLGNGVVFATQREKYSSLFLYETDEITAVRKADELSEHVPRYIPKNLRIIAASASEKKVLLIPRGENSIYVFDYTREGMKFTQRSWGKWTFLESSFAKARIVGAAWDNGLLYLVFLRKDDTTWLYTFESLTLVPNTELSTGDATIAFSPRLDSKSISVSVSLDETFATVTYPFRFHIGNTDRRLLALVRDKSDAVDLTGKIVDVTVDGVNQWTVYKLRHRDIPAGTEGFLLGYVYNYRYRFNEFFWRDPNGVPILDAEFRVKRVRLQYEDTGYFRVDVVPFLRDTYTYHFNGRPIGNPDLPTGQAPLFSGDFSIPVGARPRGTTVEISTTSYYPVSFPFAEWSGDVTPRSQRR